MAFAHEDLTPAHEQGTDSLGAKPPAENEGPRAKHEVPEFLPYGDSINGEEVGAEKILCTVRSQVDHGLEHLGFDEKVRDAAAVVVAELAGNAERLHALESVEFGVSTTDPHAAVIVVEDKLPGYTTEADRVGNIETGRGTAIVKELSADSGYEPILDADGKEVGKKVWAMVDDEHAQVQGTDANEASPEDLLDKWEAL